MSDIENFNLLPSSECGDVGMHRRLLPLNYLLVVSQSPRIVQMIRKTKESRYITRTQTSPGRIYDRHIDLGLDIRMQGPCFCSNNPRQTWVGQKRSIPRAHIQDASYPSTDCTGDGLNLLIVVSVQENCLYNSLAATCNGQVLENPLISIHDANNQQERHGASRAAARASPYARRSREPSIRLMKDPGYEAVGRIELSGRMTAPRYLLLRQVWEQDKAMLMLWGIGDPVDMCSLPASQRHSMLGPLLFSYPFL
ncbi:predicted protein [Histoplasma capsulatum H143]|uniref:Uncharacterized protein n=1 Tax=Ajellomyces capsulatus (strain H143) TaxID=544712 RepID=C6HL24_AJECH|nr:predicted protein [Histoplasma capsulatum H143]